MNPHQEIAQFIERMLHQRGDDHPFADADSLIQSGRLESIDAVEIVMFLESRFGLDFAAIGFDQSQIDSVQLILDLVRTHSSS